MSLSYKIVAVGSIDGILTASAAIRTFPGSTVEFTQAFTVDKLVPEKWGANDGVLFIDLAVNNQNEQMTLDFVGRVLRAGHRIIGVCDEHDADAWERVFAATGIVPEDLIVRPCSQLQEGAWHSSGALFSATFEMDDHGKELCISADEADRGTFTSHFARLANEAVKSDLASNARRVYLANHFAVVREADEQIADWVAEYASILKTHEGIIASREQITDAIIRVDACGKKVDMTTLLFQLYKLAKVVVIVGESYNKELKAKVVQHSFGTQDRGLDLLTAIKAAGVNAGGFAQKANVTPEDAETALQAVIALLG